MGKHVLLLSVYVGYKNSFSVKTSITNEDDNII